VLLVGPAPRRGMRAHHDDHICVAADNGGKLIVVDPRIADQPDAFLVFARCVPNGPRVADGDAAHTFLRDGLENRQFISPTHVGFDELSRVDCDLLAAPRGG